MTKKKKSPGRYQRTKGHDYERLIAQDYRDLGYTAERAIQSRGAEKCDVNVGDLPFWIECQCSDNPTIFQKLRQAQRDKKEGQMIVLHVKQNQKPKTRGKPHPMNEVVVLEKEYWFDLLKSIRSLLPELPIAGFYATGLVETLIKDWKKNSDGPLSKVR